MGIYTNLLKPKIYLNIPDPTIQTVITKPPNKNGNNKNPRPGRRSRREASLGPRVPQPIYQRPRRPLQGHPLVRNSARRPGHPRHHRGGPTAPALGRIQLCPAGHEQRDHGAGVRDLLPHAAAGEAADCYYSAGDPLEKQGVVVWRGDCGRGGYEESVFVV